LPNHFAAGLGGLEIRSRPPDGRELAVAAGGAVRIWAHYGNVEVRMDKAQLESEIAARQSEVEKVAKEMEATKKAFINAVKPFVAEWIKDRIEKAVRSNPAVTTSLGTRLSTLKQELAATLQASDAAVQTYLDELTWPHAISENRKTQGMMENMNQQTAIENTIREAIRRLLGKAGALLVKYGYCQQQSDDWESLGDSDYKYRKAYEETTNMKDLFRSYNEYLSELNRRMRALNQAITTKAEAEAGALWDKA